MDNAAGRINETHPHREFATTEKREHAAAFLPLAVLARVARLAGCTLVATVSEALTGGREPVREKSISASAAVRS